MRAIKGNTVSNTVFILSAFVSCEVDFGGTQAVLLTGTQDLVLTQLRDGVQWRTSLDDILEEVVTGTLATWVSGGRHPSHMGEWWKSP